MRSAGMIGRALWDAALCEVNAANDGKGTGGVVTELILKDAAHYADVDDHAATAAVLVKVGLWHTASGLRKCESEFCQQFVASGGKLKPGEHYFHDYFDYQFTADQSKIPIERRKEKRRKALGNNRDRCDEIVDRDGTLCRYCGRRVNPKDKRGPLGLTYDHVDPDKFDPEGGNALDDVVVACRECNGRKGDRTPPEAGMPLLEPRTSALTLVSDLAHAESGAKSVSDPGPSSGQEISDPDLALTQPDLASRARPARDSGNGPDRVKSVPETGQVGDGSERAGVGSAAGGGAGVGSGPGHGPGPVSAETDTDDREAS